MGKNSDGSSVSISTEQSQTSPDNTAHFGTAGDYGTATANKVTGKNQFAFELEHQPAYLVFQPYINNTVLHDCYLTKIEVTSNDDIAETYTVNTITGALDASALTDGKQIVLTTKNPTSGSSYNNGFPLTNSAANVATNGAYMAIKPGTHTLKVRYWIKDVATNVEGAITKTLSQETYAPNTYYDMTANLNVHVYDGDHYYMWDAQDQYWKGHEWNHGGSQPTLNNNLAGATISSDYAQSKNDSRWYHEGGGSGRFDATESCATLTNVNEMTWYAAKGDPRWDGDELWTTMGHLYKGGMWFKKKSQISGFNANTAVDGSDWRITTKYQYWSVSQTLPSAADADKYFYLPALGYYSSGQLVRVGLSAHYWSSSVFPSVSSYAYDLGFNSGIVIVGNFPRSHGFRVEPIFE